MAIALLIPALALAQTESGKITGTVTDQSGAVLPGVSVTLKSVERASTRSTVTNAQGEYVFAGLVPGNYEVTADLSGFSKKQTRTNVAVGSTVALNVQMAVGQQSEVVTVVGETQAAINTSTQDIATTVNERQIRELPTITRNAYDLVSLAGQVARDANDDRGTGYAINGLRAASTNVLLDGSANNNEFSASVGIQVPLDSVQEFSVITSNFSAQYGRADGRRRQRRDQVGHATRSPGTAYELLPGREAGDEPLRQRGAWRREGPVHAEPDGLLDWRADSPRQAPLLRQRRVHPRAQQRHRRGAGADAAAARPDVADDAGVLQRLQVAADQRRRGDGRRDRGGRGPAGRSRRFRRTRRCSARSSSSSRATRARVCPRTTIQAVGRAGLGSINNSSSAYVRYASQWQDQLAGTNANSAWEGFNTGTKVNNHNVLGSYTRVSGRTPSRRRASSSTTGMVNDQPLNGDPTPTLYLRASRTSIGGIKVALPGYLPYNPGSAIPFGGPQKLAQFYQDATWIKDRHELRFGGSFVRIMDDRTFGAFMNPVQTLGGSLGEALDNLMLGQLLQFQTAIDPAGHYPGDRVTLPVGQPEFTRNNRYNEWAVYLNDNWRLGQPADAERRAALRTLRRPAQHRPVARLELLLRLGQPVRARPQRRR